MVLTSGTCECDLTGKQMSSSEDEVIVLYGDSDPMTGVLIEKTETPGDSMLE